MSSSGCKNVQAQQLLLSLCKFIVPIAQSGDWKTITGVEDLFLGAEANDFIVQLENFISGALYENKDKSLEVTIEGDLAVNNVTASAAESANKIPHTEMPQDAPSSQNQGAIVSIPKEPEDISAEMKRATFDQRILLDKGNAELQASLYILRQRIVTYMPIRILCAERSESKLKISLLDKNGVYNHLAPKLASDFYAVGKMNSDQAKKWTNEPDDPRAAKIFNFCKVALENHGIAYGWVDTVCINKESSSELDESIRSMYKWSFEAAICITYLSDTTSIEDMVDDTWLTRGWTFQELIAPKVMKFYNSQWTRFIFSVNNDIRDPLILDSIQRATTLTVDELRRI